jgi:hypothetical protein
MTKPITHRPLKRQGRKPLAPPVDAAEQIRALAADGFSMVGVADRLSVSKDTLSRWLEEVPELKDAFDQGRENERRALHNQLYRLAMEEKHAASAMFLLKARHGYREGDQSDQGGRVNINIALPGAMTLQQFTAIGKGKTND